MRRRTLFATGAAALVPGGVLATPGVALASTDYGPAAWISANFTVANRRIGRSTRRTGGACCC